MSRPKIRTIDVFANPYSGISDEGLPQGVMQMPGSHNFIGAARDLVACEQTGKTRIYYAPPPEPKPGEKPELGAHGLRKFSVPFTAEIARAVLEGGLIVADKEHARMAGLSADDFKDAETQLAAERERALAERKAQYGDAATIAEIPTKPTERPDPAADKATAPKPAGKAAKGDKPLEGVPLAGSKNDPSLVLRKPEGV